MYKYFEQLLLERGIRTVDVCKATGISQSTLSNWKKRDNCLSPTNLKKIADFFGVTVDFFMGADSICLDEETHTWDVEESHYISDEAKEYADFLLKNPEYKILFDASKKVKAEDLKKAVKALGIFTEE